MTERRCAVAGCVLALMLALPLAVRARFSDERWALFQQGVSSDALDRMIEKSSEAETDSGARDWYVTPGLVKQPNTSSSSVAGFTMVRIKSVPEFELGAVAGDGEGKDPGEEDRSQWTAEDKLPVSEFWLSDREVSVGQFRALCPEWYAAVVDFDGKVDGAVLGDQEPVRNVNWYEALIFCNRLSRAHGFTGYYLMNEGEYDWEQGVLKEIGRAHV